MDKKKIAVIAVPLAMIVLYYLRKRGQQLPPPTPSPIPQPSPTPTPQPVPTPSPTPQPLPQPSPTPSPTPQPPQQAIPPCSDMITGIEVVGDRDTARPGQFVRLNIYVSLTNVPQPTSLTRRVIAKCPIVVIARDPDGNIIKKEELIDIVEGTNRATIITGFEVGKVGTWEFWAQTPDGSIVSNKWVVKVTGKPVLVWFWFEFETVGRKMCRGPVAELLVDGSPKFEIGSPIGITWHDKINQAIFLPVGDHEVIIRYRAEQRCPAYIRIGVDTKRHVAFSEYPVRVEESVTPPAELRYVLTVEPTSVMLRKG